MLRKRLVISLTLVVVLALGIITCGTIGVGAAEKKIVIGSSIITYEHPFYIDVVNGMKRVVEKAGIELLLNDPKCKLAPQVSALETYIARGVDALVVYGVDPVGVVPVVEEAIAKGIPVITADMELQTDKVVTFVGSNNIEIGTKVGKWTKEYIEKNMGGKAKIAVVAWLVSVAQQQRVQGFKDQVTQLPGVEIVTTQNVEEALRENAMTVTENILTAHKDVDFIYGSNQTCCMGAVSAVEALGAEVKVVGVDIDTEMVRAIKEGKLFATVAQQPLLLGEAAMQAAMIKIKGKECLGSDFVPERITIPVLLVSKDNLDEATKKLEILAY
ncbi:MAG: sugar ABC transporter substrate-binding protein [Candidatus Aminicenantes bacterium]|nr:MAG: sugar ABC transporter substrate-binding protein [Candidatus Aminicenantes bacterium]